MVDPDRRPTAQEIEELIDLVRRDPGSPAFIDLGEAYLALGRPRDAIGVGNLGLEASPDSLEGRVMLARAHAALHQWKEAQGELLRVVKIDRSNRQGFALLGEVLLRRSDFERAVPVLQHAQNLDPTSPQILSMLKRARAGQTLDAPAPIPTPVPPRGETNHPLTAPPSSSRGEPMRPAKAPPPAPRPPAPPMQQEVPKASPQMRTLAIQPSPEITVEDPAAAPRAPAFAEASAPISRQPKQTAPPPMSVEGVRPRVIATSKPSNAAAASLRQSAAVGESYLNDLLTGGLLEVAGVRVPDSDFDLRPDRRWGRSTRRAFIFLFVVLILGIGGGGTWYWWSQKQTHEAIARLQKEASQAIVNGDFAGLEVGVTKLIAALKKDDKNQISIAYFAEVTGLETMLYGTETERVDEAIKKLGKDLQPGDPGARELVIGKAALEIGRLGQGQGPRDAVLRASISTLAETRKMLDEYLAKNEGDKWAIWLKARAQLAAGERKAGRATLKLAADGDDGLVVAMIDQADMLVDDGQLDEAVTLYDKVTAKSKDHPLAVMGRSLGRAEASVQVNDAIDELSVKLDKPLGRRVAAYRNLALALANAGIEDYTKSAEALRKAAPGRKKDEPRIPTDARFWARVAWLHYAIGDLGHLADDREGVVFYTTKPEDDPTKQVIDAAISLASGLPNKALDIASRIEGVRARLLRAYALLDLGKAKDALAEADALLKLAPENVEGQIVREQARMIASTDKERGEAASELEKLARKARSKLGRHALGVALYATGDVKNAQIQLEQALTEMSEVSPNPLQYRTRTVLAQILFDAGDLVGAKKQLDDALAVNGGYFPALGLFAKIAVRNGDPDLALQSLDPIFKQPEATTPQLLLVQAEALIISKKSSPKDKDNAKAILEAIKDKVTPPTEVSRVAALIDPKLPKELGLPEPVATPAPGAPGTPPKALPKPPKKRGR